MPNTIKLKRGNQATLPSLQVGEPAFTLDTKKLYVGTEEGNIPVGANGDNSTINTNPSGDLQALGNLNRNTSTAKYDWIGTLSEYNTQVGNGTIQSNWVCFITDDNGSFVPVDSTPVGSVQAWPSDTPPEGYYICDGSAKSKIGDAELYAVIGDTYGSDETTFNLPDYRGLMLVGKNSSDTDFNELGKTGGSKTHIQTIEEMPNHSHPVTYNTNGAGSNTGGTVALASSTSSSTFPSGSAGGGQAMDIMNPYSVCNYIIKYRKSSVTMLSSSDILQMIKSALIQDAEKKHPVGSLEFNVSGNNPNSYLGVGTWELWGSGRVPVGIDTSDGDFNIVEKTSGSKSHYHTPGDTLTACIGSPTGNANAIGFSGTQPAGPNSIYSVGNSTSSTTNGHPGRSHNTLLTGHTQYSSSVQPSIVCYMWKRVS